MLKSVLVGVIALALAAAIVFQSKIVVWLRTPDAFYVAIIGAIIISLGMAAWVHFFREGDPGWRRATVAALIGFAFTAFVAWRTIEDANREQAESRIAHEGYTLLDYEVAEPHLRCLYDWYDGASNEACVREILREDRREKWTQTLLYIEEVLWILDESRQVEDRYGAAYSDDIDYWREDVVDDVTGMFSYYIVEESAQEHRRYLTRQRVDPEFTPQPAACIAAQWVRDAGIPRLSSRLCANHSSIVAMGAPGRFATQPASWCTPGQDVLETCRELCGSDERC